MENKSYFINVGVINGDIEAALRVLKKKLRRNSQAAETTARSFAKPSERKHMKEHLAQVRKFKEQSRRRRENI